MTRILPASVCATLLFALPCKGEAFQNSQHDMDIIGPRGGGIFSSAVDMADKKTAEISATAKKKAAQLDQQADKLADQARKQAFKEQARLEREATRLAKEAEKAARIKKAQLEKVARQKVAQYEKAARKKAAQVSAAVNKVARTRVADLEKATNKRVANLEKSVTGLLGEVDKKLNVLEEITEPGPYTSSVIRQNVIKVALGFIIIMGSVTATMNILGQPSSLVIDQWQNTVFGEKFFNILNLDITRKRILAGFMELAAVLMMINEKMRKYGAALIGSMYARGTVINTEIDQWKAIATGVGTALATFIFLDEIIPDTV